MRIFITGTDTGIGKTIISSWLCMHTGYSYFKPIQTGSAINTDSKVINKIIHKNNYIRVYKEIFVFKAALSPHLAAALEKKYININKINFTQYNNIIIEGAGGVLVPINKQFFMLDVIKKANASVIVVAKSILGTINHTLLTLAALRARNIKILGVILNCTPTRTLRDHWEHKKVLKSIEFYGNTKILACIPKLARINKKTLLNIPFTKNLQQIFKLHE